MVQICMQPYQSVKSAIMIDEQGLKAAEIMSEH